MPDRELHCGDRQQGGDRDRDREHENPVHASLVARGAPAGHVILRQMFARERHCGAPTPSGKGSGIRPSIHAKNAQPSRTGWALVRYSGRP
jgi:hypothetical protein